MQDYSFYDVDHEEDFGIPDVDFCGTCGEEICTCYDDICCYDPRSTMPNGYCACKEHAEEQARIEYRAAHWFYSRWDKLVNWYKYTCKIHIYKNRIKRYFQGWKPVEKDNTVSAEELPF